MPATAARQHPGVQPPALAEVLGGDCTDAYFCTHEFKLSLLHSVIAQLQRCAELYSELPAFPEAFAGALRALDPLLRKGALPDPLRAAARALHTYISDVGQKVVAQRRPLVRSRQAAAPVVKEFNPRCGRSAGSGL